MLTRKWMFSVLIFCSLILLLGTGCNLPKTPGGDVDNSKGPVLPAPQFSVPPGKYRKDIIVYLTHPSAGAQIRYTTNGDDPLTDGVRYTPIPITRGKDMIIKAYAVIDGKNSPVVSAGYKVTGKVKIGTPEIYTGKDGKKRVFVTLDPPGAKMRYTQDGSDPTVKHGNLYSYDPDERDNDKFAIVIDKPDSLKFLAFCPDWDNSDIETVKSIDLKVQNPVFHNEDTYNGYYEYNHRVRIICQNPGAVIRYSDVSSTVINTRDDGNAYDGRVFYLTKPVTYTARAFLDKWQPSEQVTQSYNVRLPAPTFDPPEDLSVTHSIGFDLDINCKVPGATIYYTIDDSTPDTASATKLPKNLNNSTTVKAIAYLPSSTGWIQSDVATATYNFGVDLPELNSPSASGEYFHPLEITIKNAANPNIRYFYTINGADPDPDNPTAPGQFEYNGSKGGSKGFSINKPVAEPGMPNHMAHKETGVAVLKICAGLFEANTLKNKSGILTRKYIFKVTPPYGHSQDTTFPEPFSFKLNSTVNPPFTIFYTKDGKSPLDPTSTREVIVFAVPPATPPDNHNNVDITQSCDFQAVLVKDYWANSDSVSCSYTLVSNPPLFLDKDGYPIDGKEVTYNSAHTIYLTVEPKSASIYYYLYEPGQAGSPAKESYKKGITVDKSYIIKAYAQTGSNLSDIVELKVNLECNPPDMSDIDEYNNVIITCPAMDGFNIQFTTNGLDPTDATPKSGSHASVPISQNMTVKARVVKTGWEPSQPIERIFEAKTQTPYFTDKNGLLPYEEYDAATKTTTFTYVLANVPLETAPDQVELKIDCSTDSAYKHYTRGTVTELPDDPTKHSRLYDQNISLIIITEPNSVVKAIGVDHSSPKRYVDSDVATAIVKFKVMPVKFRLNPANGSTQKENELTLSCETKGSTIHFARKGASPVGPDGKLIPGVAEHYEKPIPFEDDITAVAVITDWVSSDVTTKRYDKCSEPSFYLGYYEDDAASKKEYYLMITKGNSADETLFYNGLEHSKNWIYLGETKPTDNGSIVIYRPEFVSYIVTFNPASMTPKELDTRPK